MDFLRRKSIFEIIKEAEDDEGGGEQQAATDNTADTGTDNATGDDNQGDTNNTEETTDDGTGDNNDYGEDEDFNMDVDLDKEGGDDAGGGDDMGGDTAPTDTAPAADVPAEGEPNKANTDIFSSLSQEEQIVKIKELKNMYKDLYCSCDDILDRLNDINIDNIEQISKISTVLRTLKQYILDYLTNSFPNKSYIENDIFFNRFLAILNTVSSALEDLSNAENREK